MLLPAGSEVLSASETAMVMAMQGVTKYAKGTGIFGDILNSVTSGISGVTSWVGKKVKGLESSLIPLKISLLTRLSHSKTCLAGRLKAYRVS
ncbi:hypothetical protein S101258_01388 [Lactiplantibacillus plantarum subsp. plantarum]|uniref:Uncharacterized protein n=1 Tax=Lactiplantibacillus plantarum subsp. plantarum TaxID=337330 RepID=A0A2S3U692_LACPN|nr:hypothetical protein S101258_01388 [Lactiplantibacillus plantarum subsp. plantarum]